MGWGQPPNSLCFSLSHWDLYFQRFQLVLYQNLNLFLFLFPLSFSFSPPSAFLSSPWVVSIITSSYSWVPWDFTGILSFLRLSIRHPIGFNFFWTLPIVTVFVTTVLLHSFHSLHAEICTSGGSHICHFHWLAFFINNFFLQTCFR